MTYNINSYTSKTTDNTDKSLACYQFYKRSFISQVLLSGNLPQKSLLNFCLSLQCDANMKTLYLLSLAKDIDIERKIEERDVLPQKQSC